MRIQPAPGFTCAVEPSEGGDGDCGDSSEEEKIFQFFISCVHEGSQIISYPAEEGREIEKGIEYFSNRIVVDED